MPAPSAPHPKHVEDMNCGCPDCQEADDVYLAENGPECDCEDEEVDILTGCGICPSCGRSRWLTTEQLREHQRLQAECDEEMEAMYRDIT